VLAYDPLEAALLSHAQQRLAVFEWFGERDSRAAKALQEGLKARLALYQRLQTKITAIEAE
jgi:hypothetical protein